MTFHSEHAGPHAVRHLFDVSRGLGVWRYTDAPADVTVGGVTYRAAAISRGEVRRSEEDAHGELQITLASATPLAATLMSDGLGRRPIAVRVRAVHVASEGAVGATPADPVVVFTGTVRARRVDDAEGTCTLTVGSLLAALERPILRVITSPTCNNAVYDQLCGVDPALFSTEGTVGAISGRTVTVAEAADQADGYYTGGLLRIGTRLFFVERHTGESLTVPFGDVPDTALVGEACTITAGCDGTEATCIARFNNLRRFRGFPRVPAVNPWDDAEAGGVS